MSDGREGGMFFSVHALMSHFSQPATLDQLLSCISKDCSNARNVTNYKLPVADLTNDLRQEPLFRGFRVTWQAIQTLQSDKYRGLKMP